MGLGAFLLGAAAGLTSKREKKETKRHLFYRGRDLGPVGDRANVGGSEVKDVLKAYCEDKGLNFAKIDMGDCEIKDV